MHIITDKKTGQVRELTDEQFIAERDKLLVDWQEKQRLLQVAKEAEIEARKACVDFAFDPNKQSGTERIGLGCGYEAKAVKKLNYGFIKTEDGKTDKARIEKALQRIEKDGPAGELIAERLIKWTPDLSLTEYKQLPDKYRKIIDEVVVTTEGTPTLEIIPPKGQR